MPTPNPAHERFTVYKCPAPHSYLLCNNPRGGPPNHETCCTSTSHIFFFSVINNKHDALDSLMMAPLMGYTVLALDNAHCWVRYGFEPPADASTGVN